MNAVWLSSVLSAAGLQVQEVSGWQTRGRPYTFGPVRGVLCHDTVSCADGGPDPSLQTIIRGRLPPDPDPLPGPLAHLLLGRDAVFHVVAAGFCNHAGAGQWHGIMNGNTSFIGIEAENNGVDEPWPDELMSAYAQGCAAILTHIGASVTMCAGHKEYALPVGRKIDPDFDMDNFRQRVAAYMGGGS